MDLPQRFDDLSCEHMVVILSLSLSLFLIYFGGKHGKLCCMRDVNLKQDHLSYPHRFIH